MVETNERHCWLPNYTTTQLYKEQLVKKKNCLDTAQEKQNWIATKMLDSYHPLLSSWVVAGVRMPIAIVAGWQSMVTSNGEAAAKQQL